MQEQRDSTEACIGVVRNRKQNHICNLANKFKLTKTKKQRQNKLNLDIEDIVERFATTLLILFLSLSELN